MGDRPQRKTMRLERGNYSATGAYFLTVCTKDRRCLLSHVGTGVPDGPHIQLTKYGAVVEKYILQMNDFYQDIRAESYVIMPNHIHLLLVVCGPSRTPVPTEVGGTVNGIVAPITQKQNSAVSRYISTLKRFCNKEYGENIWQARSYDHIIRSRQDYDDHLRYIRENPLRRHYDELYCEK